ncbi:histidine kinase [uncultured Clostridium sp.]|uniref:sensor histidine kinase n=1 Tax=uncultured Clostridium sp. TaxID=59620 RepID=UPI00261CF989|nr:histidine kinase [uncultured Clostridium sp.]
MSKRRNLYNKLFVMYGCVAIFIVFGLGLYFFWYTTNNIMIEKKYNNKQLVDEVYSFLDGHKKTVDAIEQGLYKNEINGIEFAKFLDYDLIEYRKMKIGESSRFSKVNVESKIREMFESFSDINTITMVSIDKNTFTKFDKDRYVNIDEGINLSYLENKRVILNKNFINYIIRINEDFSFKQKGYMIIEFDIEKINEIHKKHGYENNILIKDSYGNIGFSRNNSILGEKENDFLDRYLTEFLVDSSYYNVGYLGNDISIIGSVEKNIFKYLPNEFYIEILIIALLILVISSIFIVVRIKKINNRLNNILELTTNVRRGNLKYKIEDINEDEIGYIAHELNFMCEELEGHINKVYMSEIEKKTSEMKYLQSQINPHFLYNTLDAIRMKALSDGNRNVAEMIYNLSILFRSQIKEKDIIDIELELYYCERYLELFKFRYDKKFDYYIEIDDGLEEVKVPKLILQPIIENYLIHGIELEADKNIIKITVNEIGNSVYVCIENNGRSMSDEKLRELNNLINNEDMKTSSIGLENINKRIKNLCGDDFGIEIKNSQLQGIKVILKIPRKGCV